MSLKPEIEGMRDLALILDLAAASPTSPMPTVGQQPVPGPVVDEAGLGVARRYAVQLLLHPR